MNKQTPRKRGRKPSKGPSVFSKNLKTLMTEKSLSSRDICRLTGSSPSVVSTSLAGSQPADSLAVLQLAERTSSDFQYLMTGVRSAQPNGLNIHDFFNVEKEADFSGIYLIEAKKLKIKGEK